MQFNILISIEEARNLVMVQTSRIIYLYGHLVAQKAIRGRFSSPPKPTLKAARTGVCFFVFFWFFRYINSLAIESAISEVFVGTLGETMLYVKGLGEAVENCEAEDFLGSFAGFFK